MRRTIYSDDLQRTQVDPKVAPRLGQYQLKCKQRRAVVNLCVQFFKYPAIVQQVAKLIPFKNPLKTARQFYDKPKVVDKVDLLIKLIYKLKVIYSVKKSIKMLLIKDLHISLNNIDKCDDNYYLMTRK